MCFVGHSRAALLLGFLLTACAVYTDDSLLAAAGGVGHAGASSSGGSSPATSFGGSATSAGKPSGGGPAASAGSPSTSKGGTGEEPTAGGAANEAGGEAAGGDAPELPLGGSGGAHAGSGGMAPGNVAGSAPGGAGGGSGTAGTGGGGPTGPTCADHPLTARSSWLVTSSHAPANGLPANLTDNKVTRWTTGKPQEGDEWLQVDFGTTVALSQINLQQAEANANDYPRNFSIFISDLDPKLEALPKLSGMGKSGVSTTILLPAITTGQFLLIKQLGSSLSWWSAVELEVSCVDPD